MEVKDSVRSKSHKNSRLKKLFQTQQRFFLISDNCRTKQYQQYSFLKLKQMPNYKLPQQKPLKTNEQTKPQKNYFNKKHYSSGNSIHEQSKHLFNTEQHKEQKLLTDRSKKMISHENLFQNQKFTETHTTILGGISYKKKSQKSAFVEKDFIKRFNELKAQFKKYLIKQSQKPAQKYKFPTQSKRKRKESNIRQIFIEGYESNSILIRKQNPKLYYLKQKITQSSDGLLSTSTEKKIKNIFSSPKQKFSEPNFINTHRIYKELQPKQKFPIQGWQNSIEEQSYSNLFLDKMISQI